MYYNHPPINLATYIKKGCIESFWSPSLLDVLRALLAGMGVSGEQLPSQLDDTQWVSWEGYSTHWCYVKLSLLFFPSCSQK